MLVAEIDSFEGMKGSERRTEAWIYERSGEDIEEGPALVAVEDLGLMQRRLNF